MRIQNTMIESSDGLLQSNFLRWIFKKSSQNRCPQKPFDKIQHPLPMNILQKPGKEGNSPNLQMASIRKNTKYYI